MFDFGAWKSPSYSGIRICQPCGFFMSTQLVRIASDVEIHYRTYNGQPVLTFAQIDQVHSRPEGSPRLDTNKEHSIESEGYFPLFQTTMEATDEFSTLAVSRLVGCWPRSSLTTSRRELTALSELADQHFNSYIVRDQELIDAVLRPPVSIRKVRALTYR